MNESSISEKVYGRLLRLYPPAFRQEFGGAMLQHFRDQLCEAQHAPDLFSTARFWMAIGLDTLKASFRQRFLETRKPSRSFTQFTTMKLPSFRFLFIAFLFPLLVGFATFIYIQPRIYLSTARVFVEQTAPLPNAHFLEQQMEIMKSGLVLEQVVEELGLAKLLSQEYGTGPLKKTEAAAMLRDAIRIGQARNTGLIEVRVFSQDPYIATEIANKIPNVYRNIVSGKAKVEMLDVAARPFRPVRPNIPLNVVLGTVMSVVLAGIAAWLLRMITGGKRSITGGLPAAT